MQRLKRFLKQKWGTEQWKKGKSIRIKGNVQFVLSYFNLKEIKNIMSLMSKKHYYEETVCLSNIDMLDMGSLQIPTSKTR